MQCLPYGLRFCSCSKTEERKVIYWNVSESSLDISTAAVEPVINGSSDEDGIQSSLDLPIAAVEAEGSDEELRTESTLEISTDLMTQTDSNHSSIYI